MVTGALDLKSKHLNIPIIDKKDLIRKPSILFSGIKYDNE